MKVLIVNKFLYARGGDCIHSLGLKQMLVDAGHETRFFSMNYPQNIATDESSLFAEEINFSATGIKGKVKAALRILCGTGVSKTFNTLLDEYQPDVVHLNNIHSYISPIVAKIAHRKGIKVLWTLHDYKLICPSYSCLYKNKVCEECFTNKRNVVLRKCMKNNLLASVLAWGEAVKWDRSKLSKWTDTFICPSKFMEEKMKSGGFPDNKLKVISNFINREQLNFITNFPDVNREESYAYIGRLSEEKGVESLLKAAINLPYKLYIAGSGDLLTYLQEKYSSNNIIFLGHLDTKKTISLLKTVSFTVIPSICYENNPLSVIESMCCGTPVLGRAIGGIPELLETSSYNKSFSNDEELPIQITKMFEENNSIDRAKLSGDSIERFSEDSYYQKWLEVAE